MKIRTLRARTLGAGKHTARVSLCIRVLVSGDRQAGGEQIFGGDRGGARQQQSSVSPAGGGASGAAQAGGQSGAAQAGGAPASASSSSGARRRRWYLGIQSKKDPAHVMTEVYKALLQLDCEWKTVDPYRLQTRWRPNQQPAQLLSQPAGDVAMRDLKQHHLATSTPTTDDDDTTHNRHDEEIRPQQQLPYANERLAPEYSIKIMLTLYKVQQNIFLRQRAPRQSISTKGSQSVSNSLSLSLSLEGGGGGSSKAPF